MTTTAAATSGNSHLSENSCSSSHYGGLEKKGLTGSQSSQKLKSQAEDVKPSQSVPCTHCSKGYDARDMSHHTKVIHSAEVESGSITFLQKPESSSLKTLTNSSAICNQASSKTDYITDVLNRAHKASFVMKLFAPIFLQLGNEEKAMFKETLILREKIAENEHYRSHRIIWWDVVSVLDLLLRHLSDRLSPTININLRLRK